MQTSKITEVTIYETPDGGHTVYARHPGSSHRKLHGQSEQTKVEQAQLEQQRRWIDIFQERKNNPELDRLCQQVEIMYELSRR
jgi:hypothetical protein